MLLLEDVRSNVLENSSFQAEKLGLVVVVWKEDPDETIMLLGPWVVYCDNEVLVAIILDWAI